MRTKTNARRVRFPALPQGDNADEFLKFVLDDAEDAACSEYVVMSQERDMPALQEYLHELQEHDRAAAI